MKIRTSELTLNQLIKKLLLIVIGSGLISNALYYYGLSYYQGYIERLGFEYNFFPIEWGDTLAWTYHASQDIGASALKFWITMTGPAMVIILVISYVLARIWMSISEIDRKNTQINRGRLKRYKLSKCFLRLKSKYPKKFACVYPSIRWLLLKEQSWWAFVA